MNTGAAVLLLVAGFLLVSTVLGITVELVGDWLKRDFGRRYGVDPEDYL